MAVPFSTLEDDFLRITGATVATLGRPRTRVLHPIWQVIDNRPVGWVGTSRAPLKTRRSVRLVRLLKARRVRLKVDLDRDDHRALRRWVTDETDPQRVIPAVLGELFRDEKRTARNTRSS